MMHFTVVNDGASTGSPLRTLEHKLPGAAPQGRAVLEAVALSPQDLELRADFAEACLTARFRGDLPVLAILSRVHGQWTRAPTHGSPRLDGESLLV
jgi:hypothetical protein